MRRAALLLGVLFVALVFGPPLAAKLFGWGLDPSLLPPPGSSVRVRDGLQLNVVEVGSGPAVFLVHGLPSCAADWADFPARLAAHGYRVIAYDRIGYGHSSRAAPTPDSYTYESNARDLEELMSRLYIKRGVVVGWSYGGAVVQSLAQRAPQRISHLVLVAAVGPAQPEDAEDALSTILASPVGGAILRWVGSIPPLSRRMTHDSLVQAFAGEAAIPPHWIDYTRTMLALPGTLNAFVLEAQRGRVAELRPESLEVPTLILQGANDYLVPPLVADDLHRRIPGSELTVIPGGSHMLPVTHPELLAEKIHAFLSAAR
jgi:pimeloyl-ACP methyl ester carboxylesterase